jgi:hypothetical protein
LKCVTNVIGLDSLADGCSVVNVRRPMRETAAVLKLMRRGAIAGLLAGAGYAIWRFLASRAPDTGGVTFEASPFPSLPRPVPKATTPTSAPAPVAAAAPAAAAGPWVDPVDGACPASHPIKAKLTSGIYHEPGGGNYDRTRAERCYVDTDAAIADGLRAPKRG